MLGSAFDCLLNPLGERIYLLGESLDIYKFMQISGRLLLACAVIEAGIPYFLYAHLSANEDAAAF